jgi:hypothetical protein
MQFYQPSKSRRSALAVIYTAAALSHSALSLCADPSVDAYADKILNRANTDPQAIDRNADGQVDVRDLAIYIDGQPIFATFGTAETLAFHSQGSVTLPIYFSKPVTGTLKFDLGGTAEIGAGKDFTLSQTSVTVTNAKSTQITVNFQPWRGVGGEKVLRLTLNRDPLVIPNNGTFSSHLLRVRQFDAGEFVGLLTFPPGSGLPTIPVRLGLTTGGSAFCSFEQKDSFLGNGINLSWALGSGGFPAFSGSVPLTIPADSLNRPPGSNVNASLAISRSSPPYDAATEAYLEGFPPEDQPVLYQATLTFHNLIAAGARFSNAPNPYAVVQQGRLTLQPVRYAAEP